MRYKVKVRARYNGSAGSWADAVESVVASAPTATPTPTATPELETAPQIVSLDRDVLVALYNATGGANWTKKDKWLSNDPLGDWHGVTTDSTGRVIKLLLNDNQLNGTVPAALGSLANLKELELSPRTS